MRAISRACIHLACWTPLAVEAAPPPEEIRVGSLGQRGVVFMEKDPERFREDVSGAGDVNGDGLDDFLVAVRDRDVTDPETYQLVFGRRDWPQLVDAGSLLSL